MPFALMQSGCNTSNPKVKDVPAERIVANPLNLNYRFHYDDKKCSRREAADPCCEYFKGKYYLFASKSGGYWSSRDLATWTFIPCSSIKSIENYAPTIMVLDDALYFMASWDAKQIYRNPNPDFDSWELVDSKLDLGNRSSQDPCFFRDDDGRVYFYCGCSPSAPIWGAEVNPKDGFKIVGEVKDLIEHNAKTHGWENPGGNNELNREGWNEGPCMVKYAGSYYLQYASPGTEFRPYADGVYVSDKPLGPFTYMKNSPFSFKPGGFVGGAGHGHTFADKYGNYWHVASMKVCVREGFERRLGLFPLGFNKDGSILQKSVWSDYPCEIPDKKVDFNSFDYSMGWNLLSYRKPSTASSGFAGYDKDSVSGFFDKKSILEGFAPERAFDEAIETWWSAASGDSGEWLQVDLTRPMEVRAVQVNFADEGFNIYAPHEPVVYKYMIEASDDGETWKTVVDKSNNKTDAPHELCVLDTALTTRFLRIVNTETLPGKGKFSLFDFRVFGNGLGKKPEAVTGFKAVREDDRRRYSLSWDKQEGATGYIVNVTLDGKTVTQSVMVFDNSYEGGFFNSDADYEFSVQAFNENGVGE